MGSTIKEVLTRDSVWSGSGLDESDESKNNRYWVWQVFYIYKAKQMCG